jgi:secreted trypsin-like serine protease
MRNFIFLLLFPLFVPSYSLAIINGGNSDWPNAVALVNKIDNSIFCSGVLVTPRIVLTAAHCLSTRGRNKVNPKDIGIHLGNGSLSGKTLDFVDAKRTEFRKCYKTNTECDFGFIELQNDLPDIQVNIATEDILTEYINKDHPELIYVGFGTDERGKFGVRKKINHQMDSIPSELITDDLKVGTENYKNISLCSPPYSLDSEACFFALLISSNYENVANIHRSKIFNRNVFNAFSVFSVDLNSNGNVFGVAQGDSGGPLYIKIREKVLLAAINIGGTDNSFYAQSVSIPIFPHLNWLKSKIKNLNLD